MMDYTIFGESHGPAVGVLLRDVPPGLPVDEEFICRQLLRRAPQDPLSTARHEPDQVEVLSGVYQGVTTGMPVCLLLRNRDVRSADYDALKNNTQPVMSQQLLSPLAVELSAEDAASLLEQLPLLEEFGFVCEDFGDGTVLVRQVPSDLEVGDVPAALEELAEELRLNRADPAAARDSLLQTMACKSAIKAGMWSDPSELQALADKVQSGEIRYCPHGRPVAVKLSKYEMEKMFKRA